jgi:hypothetical protein
MLIKFKYIPPKNTKIIILVCLILILILTLIPSKYFNKSIKNNIKNEINIILVSKIWETRYLISTEILEKNEKTWKKISFVNINAGNKGHNITWRKPTANQLTDISFDFDGVNIFRKMKFKKLPMYCILIFIDDDKNEYEHVVKIDKWLLTKIGSKYTALTDKSKILYELKEIK